MASMQRGARVASILTLAAIIISGCNQPYSKQPSVTNTPINPDTLFATPLGQTPNITMSDVANFGTQTALASQAGTPGTPAPATATSASGITPQVVTATATLAVSNNAAPTASPAVSGPTPTALPPGSQWILKQDEFPYCIARRYNVNPEDLLRASGLTSPDIYYEGQKLTIPQNSTWPASLGPRSLHTHPDTYTVTGNADTSVYGVACKYGDVLPADIASVNGISVDSKLTVGKSLKIP